MLKFADLSVDFKSYENSLNSYMKLFPGSYTPLLIMCLAHKGLLKLVHEFEENDPRIIVSVDGESLHDFFGDDIMKELIPDPSVWKKKGMTLEETLNLMNNAILKDRDVYVMLPFVQMWGYIVSGQPLALIADVSKDDQIVDLINCIASSDHATDNPAALLYFSVMLMTKYEPTYDDNYYKKLTPEEIEHDKKLELEIWIEDFENTLNTIMSYAGNNYWIQPEELTRVILTQYKGGSIYNPFAGLASYAIQLHYDYEFGEKEFCPSDIPAELGDIYYYGEEIDKVAWAVGKLRLLAYDSDSKNYIHGDSTEWREGIADNILSTPPFMQIRNEDGKKEFADHFVIRRGIDMLSEDGLLACVVPMSFMSRKDTADIRERIVEEGILESIVYLPENIYSNTSVRTAIIFIRKRVHNHVNLINATTTVFRRSGKINVLNEEVVATLLRYNYEQYTSIDVSELEDLPEEAFKSLKVYPSNDWIAKSNYDLTPGRYFIDNVPNIEGFRLIKVGDIVKGIPGNIGKAGKGKVVRPALLSKDNFTPLFADNIPEEEYKKQYKVVNQDALLFSPLASLRPTLFVNPSKENIYLKSDTVQAVYLKKEAIDLQYLILELNKPYVQEQVRLLTKGDVIPRLSVEDFLSIQVYVPNSSSRALELEKESVEQQKTQYYSEINAELAALKDKQHDDYIKMLRQRKHRIQQFMNEFSPAFSMLNQLRKENGGVLHDSDVVATRTGKTVGDYFDKLESIVAKVEDLITNLIDKELWKQPEAINMIDFINSIPENHISDKFVFQIEYDYEKTGKYAGLAPFFTGSNVMIAPNDLSTIFDNIISNAIKYGFTENIRKDYVIRIFMMSYPIEDDYYVRISVSNNGNPIHPSLDRGRFFDWGYGSNTGIGTWQIKSIVEHYGGKVELNEYPNDAAGFYTEYAIYLPLIKPE